MTPPANMFAPPPAAGPDEAVDVLAAGAGCRVERIVSRGHASPPGFWYDQEWAEWVALLSGSATLRFDDGGSVELRPGDWLHIPARRRHRVERTDAAGPTVWLAVHFDAG